MYAGGASGVVGSAISAVQVSPIEGKAGYLVHNALTDRLGAAGKTEARYRLDVRLDEKLTGMIVQSDDSVSRERRVMRARYQLVDLNTGAIMLDDTADVDAGIDIVSDGEFGKNGWIQYVSERLEGLTPVEGNPVRNEGRWPEQDRFGDFYREQLRQQGNCPQDGFDNQH